VTPAAVPCTAGEGAAPTAVITTEGCPVDDGAVNMTTVTAACTATDGAAASDEEADMVMGETKFPNGTSDAVRNWVNTLQIGAIAPL
jgi:hypothetical protein